MSRRRRTSFLRTLGPGLITGAADDDPSGIATYSQVGAQFGYTLGWTIPFSYPLLVVIQGISAGIGAVTGQGIAQNLRRHYPPWVMRLAVLLARRQLHQHRCRFGGDGSGIAVARRWVSVPLCRRLRTALRRP